jgi:hypothetical protein
MKSYGELQQHLIDTYGSNAFAWPKDSPRVHMWATMQALKFGYISDAAEEILSANQTARWSYDAVERRTGI